MQHTPAERTLLQKTWLRLLTGAILLITILLLTLPIAGKYYFTNWLLENGADTAVIEKISFNPFKAQVSLDGVNVTIGETTVLSDATIVVNVGLMSILNKQVNIEETVLQDVTLDLELLDDGSMRIASYTTAPSAPETQATETQTEPSISWVVLARHVSINNCTVHFKMPDMNITLQIDDALLSNLSTEPGASSGTFSFKGSVNGTPVVFDLNNISLMPDLSAQGVVTIDGFALDSLANVLKPSLQPFAGQASVDGTMMFRMTPSMDIFADYDGMISLENGHIAGDSFSVQGAPVRWEQGTIHFETTEQKGILIEIDGTLTGKNLTVDIPDPVINIQEPDLAINGKVQVTIDDEVRVATCADFTLNHTTFSMPPLSAESSTISWQGRDQCIHFNSGTTAKALSVQAQGKLAIEEPSFSDQDKAVQLAVSGTSLSWDGRTSYLLGLNEQVPSTVQTNGKLAGEGLTLTLADTLSYKQGSLTADGQSSVNLATALTVNYAGALDLKSTELKAAGVDTTVDEIAWIPKNSGSVTFTLADDSSIHLALNGDLKTQGAQAKIIESGLLFAQQELAISTNGTLLLGQETTLKGTSSLALNGFTIQEKDASPLVALGSISINSIEAPGGQKVHIKQAEIQDLAVNTEGGTPLKATISDIMLNDIHTEDLNTFTTEIITAQKPKVIALKNNTQLAGLNSLEIHKMKASLNQQVTVKHVNFDDLFFLGKSVQKGENICRLDSARLSDIGWNPEQGLQGRSLSLAGLFCTLVREKNGSFTLSNTLAAISNSESETTVKAAQDTKKQEPALKINLEQITLRGDSGLHIEDHTLAVPYIGDWDITTLQIKNLNSNKPEAPASLKMVGLLNGRAPIKITGTIAPFLEPLAMDMKIKLKNYPLVRLSPYSVQAVGVALAAGELKVKSTIKISDNKLDMENDVLIKKLETSTLSKELADKLNNQLPIPLDSALSLLRDSDDNIHLSIPLKGPLGELNVGVSDVLITALSKAIVPAASGYLMYTLGPYGALAWVGMKVGEKMLQINLPPVEFPPGKATLADNLDDYFSRLAKILKEKPNADYQLCPQSSAWEFISDSEKEKLDEKALQLNEQDRIKLMKLGQERAQNIKNDLVEKYLIDKNRLLICVSKIDMKKSAKPRVDIQM